ncbi:MAG: hypothetical protein IH586_03380 [Anaerolineaceae bacterium]|nr:hypothetical protein [Anaerolineaceae bacterium]
MKKQRFAYFITPHGYGHAARAAAVMGAIREQEPDACFEIFTMVPVWFFNMSIPGGFGYHALKSDIGLVQTNSMIEDLPETVRQLDELLSFRESLINPLAEQVRALGCTMVLCDIAPLGIAVAKEAGLPSVLIENFTWDWIYEGYLAEEPGLAPHITSLNQIFRTANWHIRTEPACTVDPPADLTTAVVSRKPRFSRKETRDRLGISRQAKLVMITMGGILTEYPFLDQLENSQDTLFLIPGGSSSYEKRGSLVLIPHHSDLYHPDLVGASDAIVGKLGYSTLAEAYAAGVPYAYLPRIRFREGLPMGAFAQKAMGAIELTEERFFSGSWLDVLPELFSRGRRAPEKENGADQAGRFVLGL